MTRPDTRNLKLVAASLAIAAASALSLTAFAHDPSDEGGAAQTQHHHGFCGDQRAHPPGMPDMRLLGGRALDHLLDKVKATDAQRTQIHKITQAAADDLKAQHETGSDLRDRVMAVLTAPQVDATAAEKLRQEMLAEHDRMSRRVSQAMIDVAQILTPEQRATLAAEFKERQQRMQEHRKHLGQALSLHPMS